MAGGSIFPRHYVSKLVPSNQVVITALLIIVSCSDAMLLGYDSSVMGSLNVMPSYQRYFTLTSATRNLLTSASYMGGGLSCIPAGWFADKVGRKWAIFSSCVFTSIGAILQGAAQNVAMFIVGRITIGFGIGIAAVAVPVYLSEVCREEWRSFCMGLYLCLWPVGTILASTVSWRTEQYDNEWSWRIPGLLQLIWSFTSAVTLLFVPESPRWLINQDRQDDALEVLAVVRAEGDKSHPEVQLIYREIVDTIAYEKGEGKQKTLFEVFSSGPSRKRMIMVTTFSIPVMCSGALIIAYYFGTMLTLAGVDDPLTQLEVNIILQIFLLLVGLLGSWFLTFMRRKMQMGISMGGSIITFFIYAALVAVNSDYSSKSLTYGAIAMIFLHSGFYNVGMNVMISSWPPEILSYRIRSVGMGMYTLCNRSLGVLVTLVFPIGMENMGWKFYILNACLDIVMLAFMLWYYVETSNLTLEEVDIRFEGIKHSDVPNLRDLKKAGGRNAMAAVLEGVEITADPVEEIVVSDKKEGSPDLRIS